MNAQPTGHDAVPSYTAEYQRLLEEATTALTAAARLRRPVLMQTDDGQWIEDLMGRTEQSDWAEFVTLALAGAAANFGGIEAILAGRSGSWEAEAVRNLLGSTVGPDEAGLWAHRTEPVAIKLYVDELLSEHSRAPREYDDALAEIDRRRDAVADPEIDEYVWWYDRTETGEYVARSPEAPPWSLVAFRAQPLRPGVLRSTLDFSAQDLALGAATGAYIFRSQEAAEQVWRLEDEQEAALDRLDAVEERLRQQQQAEWRAYGEAVRERIKAAAARVPGLMVPVEVTIDVDTYRASHELPSDGYDASLEARLVETAVTGAPTPDDLPGTPLSRLTAGGDVS